MNLPLLIKDTVNLFIASLYSIVPVIIIRTIHSEDLFAIIRLASTVLTETYSPSLFTFFYETSPETFIVAEEHHKIIGFAIGIKQPNTIGRIVMIGTSGEKQRRGVGSNLLRHLITLFSTNQTPLIELEVKKTNTNAIRFYQKHGFHIIEEIPNFYQDGVAAFIMRRTLSAHTSDD